MQMFDQIAVFGCKATTMLFLENLDIPYPVAHLITIGPELGQRHEVADYCRLKEAAEGKGIQVYEAAAYGLKKPEDLSYINALDLDIVLAIGWQRLIPAAILEHLRVGAFGMHGSAMNLPQGRGRSPLNWSILEGRQVFYTNLFRYDPGIDSGDIVDTLKFQIAPRDTAEILHFKNTLAMKTLIERNIERLVRNDFQSMPQDASIPPTYYPKREPADSLIDWDADVYAIDRLIRAVARPFNGAFTFAGTEQVAIWDAQVFDLNDFGYSNLKPGTVAAVFPNGKFLIWCCGGLLLVHAWEANCAIVPGLRFHDNHLPRRHFQRNALGYYDVKAE